MLNKAHAIHTMTLLEPKARSAASRLPRTLPLVCRVQVRACRGEAAPAGVQA